MAKLDNLPFDLRVFSTFNFPHLRILYLTDLQYDAECPSTHVEQLVAILKGAPNVIHLELSLRHKIGFVTKEGQFQHRRQTRERHFFRALCLQYAEGGETPLRLKTLRLGFGCEIDEPGEHNQPHYIWQLMDLACLEELHLEQVHYQRGRNLDRLSLSMGFQLLTSNNSPPGMECGVLPAIRKITWPRENSRILELLSCGDQDFLSRIILRIPEPYPEDWLTEDGPPSWVAEIRDPSYRSLRLRGLVLHAETMSPEDTEELLDFVPYMRGLQSLRIRMPHLTQGVNQDWKRHRDFMEWFWARMLEMKDLRELWLAEGLGTWKDGHRYIDPYPTDDGFEYFAIMFGVVCKSLTWLRILDRGWRIVRQPGTHLFERRALNRWEVLHDLPETFDFSRPKLIL